MQVLHYEVSTTGAVTAIPYILSAALKCVIGPIANRMTFMSERVR